MQPLLKLALLPLVIIGLVACGQPPTEQNNSALNEQNPVANGLQINAQSLTPVPFKPQTKVRGAIASGVNASSALNAVGGFDYPVANSQFNGNLTVAINASDAQGIKQAYLSFGQGELAYAICSADCGAELSATISGINPALFGEVAGQVIVELWLEDNDDNLQLTASLPLVWQPKTIGGVVAAIDPDTLELTLTWTTDDTFLWYNVYIANAPHVTSSVINELPGGTAELGIRGNEVRIANKPLEPTYYLVVVGVDGTGESAYSSEITLVGGLDFTPPTAVRDTFTTSEDVQLQGNLIANDLTTGTNALTLDVAPVTAPSHGTVVLNSDGSFSYTPAANFNGNDQFSYQLTSTNGLTATGLVEIMVSAVNDAPVATDDLFIIETGTLTVGAPGLLANDLDVDGEQLMISPTPATAPIFGSVNLAADGSFSYQTNDSFTTFDEFSYQVIDSAGEASTALVILRSPDFKGYPPFANADNYQVNEDELLEVAAASGVLANDEDRDTEDSLLSFTLTEDVAHGTLVLMDDGSFSYQPDANFNGQDHFKYSLSDPEGNQTIALVTINVDPANDPPVANNDEYLVANVLDSTIPNGLGLLANDGDIDGDTLTISLADITQPSSGSVTVNANGSFVYAPQAGFVGTDSFTYRLTDGTATSGTATVQLHVVNAHTTTDDETPVIVDTVEILSQFPPNATLEAVSASFGTVTLVDGVITYTPNEGQAGNAVITLDIIIDGIVNPYQLVVQVLTDNDVPVITSSNSVTIAENLAAGSTVLQVQATDPDGDALSYGITDPLDVLEIDGETGAITVKDAAQLDFEARTELSILLSVFDEFDAVANQTITITLTNVDEPAVITSALQFDVAENTPPGSLIYQITVADPEGQPVTVSFVDEETPFSLNQENGHVTVIDPDVFDYETSSSASLSFLLDDGSQPVTRSVAINVLNVNEGPQITSANQFAIDENSDNGSDTGYTATHATDPEGHSIAWSISQDAAGVFAIDGTSGVLTVADNTQLDFELNETYQFTITATETNGEPTNLFANLTITVTINDVEEGVDSDGDGLTDDQETSLGTNINDPDSDDDNLTDGAEVELGTDPLDNDSDDDLVLDGDEVAADTDPLSDDRTAPVLVNVNPADGAVDVCTNQGINIQFDESLRASTITSSEVVVRVAGGADIAGNLGLSLSKRDIFFQATDPLPQDTDIQIEVSGVKDAAGNVMASTISSTFQTGSCLESDRPVVTRHSPWQSAQNVPINAVVYIQMDEPVNPFTVNHDNVKVVDQLTGDAIAGELSLSSDNTLITFTPASSLSASHYHSVSIVNVEDVYGNVMVSYSFAFETGFAVDNAPTNVATFSGNDSGLNYPQNGYVAVLFDEPINPVFIDNITLTEVDMGTVPTVIEIDDHHRRLKLVPQISLVEGISYQMTVDGILDLAGNVMADPATYLIAVGADTDLVGGDIEYLNLPSSNIKDIPRNSSFYIESSELIDATLLYDDNFYLYNNTLKKRVDATTSYDKETFLAKISPTELLINGHQYYLYLGDDQTITDTAGNVISYSSSRYFYAGADILTGDFSVAAQNFPDGSLIMPINSTFIFDFNREVAQACLHQADIRLLNDTTEVDIEVSLNSARDGLEISPVNDLISQTSYAITIDGLCDLAGNPLATQNYTFSTGSDTSADTTGPDLVAITPAHQATEVATDAVIVMEFDEDIALTAAPDIFVQSIAGNVIVQGEYSVNGNLLTFTPDEPLLGSHRYRAHIYSTVADMAGNTRYNGVQYFDTVAAIDATPPSVISITPADGSAGVSSDLAEITVTFSEPLNPNTVSHDNFLLYIDGELYEPDVSRSADNRTVMLAESLPENAMVSVIITSDVTDFSANPLPYFVSSFMTGEGKFDNSRGVLNRQIPFNGSTNVSEANNIYLYFSKKLDSNSLAEGITITENGKVVDVDLSLLPDGQTVQAHYATGFGSGAQINSFISEDLLDEFGVPVYATETYFEVGYHDGAVGVSPIVEAHSPSGYNATIPLNAQIKVRFNEPMDVSTFTDQTVTFFQANGETSFSWVPLAVDFSFDATAQVITIVPTELLVPDSNYYINIDREVLDTDGDRLYYDFYDYIYTDSNAVVDDRQPMVTSVSPASGLEDVGVWPAFSMTFDEWIDEVSFNPTDLAEIYFDNDNRAVRYHYYQPLPANAAHTEVIGEVADLAGNLTAATTTTFNTGPGADLDSPVLLAASYSHNDIVPRNAIFEYFFSEAINPQSVANGGVYIYDLNTGETIPSNVELTFSGRKLTLTPETDLPARHNFYVYVSGLYDLSQNALSFSYISIETEATGADSQFALLSTSVAQGETNVPTNVKLNARFNRTLGVVAEPQLSLVDSTGQAVEIISSVSRSRTLLTVMPRALLKPNETYRWQLGAAPDTAGNVLDTPIDITFTTAATADVTPGNIVAWSFNHAAKNVPVNPFIAVTFDEKIDPTTIDRDSFYLRDNTSGLSVPSTWTLSADQRTVTLVPDNNLRENIRYYLYVGHSPHLYDPAGNRASNNAYRYFTTGVGVDNDALSLTATNLALTGTNNIYTAAQLMPINGVVQLEFDQAVSDGCDIASGVSLTQDGSPVEVDIDLNSDRNVLEISGVDDLVSNTSYLLSVSQLCDFAGNAITPMQISFDTSSATTGDNSGPSFVAMSPAPNATDVSTNISSITVEFDEAISTRTNFEVIGAGNSVPGSITVNGNIATFQPSIELLGETEYSVELNYNVEDLAGKTRYLGDRRFVTAARVDNTAPTVTSISPANNASDIDADTDITIGFSEPVLATTITAQSIAVFHDGVELSTSRERSADGLNVRVTGNLPEYGLIEVVLSSQITDMANNALATQTFRFETAGASGSTTRPTVAKQIPSTSNSPQFDVDKITFYLSRSVSSEGLEDKVLFVEDGEVLDVNIDLSGDGKVMIVTPVTNFKPGARIEFYLEGITDDLGNVMTAYSGYVVIGDESSLTGLPAYMVASYPASSQEINSLNPVIMVRFTEPMDISTVNTANVIVTNASDNDSVVSAALNLIDQGYTLTITPDQALVADSSYDVEMTTNLLDTDGDPLYSTSYVQFTTSADAFVDDVAPTILAMSPPQGSENVGVNVQYSVRFDEPINPLTFEFGNDDIGNIFLSEDNKVVRYVSVDSLAPNSPSTKTISGVTDGAGNLAATASTTFNVGASHDLISPVVTDVPLVNNQQDVSTTVNVTWTFSEPIDPVSLSDENVYFYRSVDGNIAADWQLSDDGLTLTMSPSLALQTDLQYYVYLANLRDLSGNQMSQQYRYFTTSSVADTVAPQVVSTNINDADTGVPINATVRIRFDEIIDAFASDEISFTDSGGAAVPVAFELTRERSLLNIVPKRLLDQNENYTVTVENVNDISGNVMTAPITFSFTTGTEVDLFDGDDIGWSYPSNNPQDFPLNPLLQVHFSEALDRTTIDENSFYLQDTTNSVKVPATWQLTNDDKTLTLEPESVLASNAQHYFYVSQPPYLTDVANNRIASSSYRRFVTGTAIDSVAPTVVQTNIADGSQQMPVNGYVALVFDERLGDGCDITETIQLLDGSTVVPAEIQFGDTRQTVEIWPNELLTAATTYTVNLTGVCDYAGNVRAGQVLTFTTLSDGTEDTSGPTLLSMTPSDDATDVDVNTTIVLQFSEVIDLRSQPTITQNGSQILGTYEVSGDTITFTPSEPLANNETISIGLLYLVPDFANNTSYGGYRSFDTGG